MMCSIDSADPWKFASYTTPRARKAHRCDECERTIHPTETYHLIRGLTDDYWSTTRICRHCNAAAQWLVEVCGGWLLGGLREELREHWDEGYRSIGFGRLIAGLRLKWHDGRDPVPTGVAELAKRMLAQAVAS